MHISEQATATNGAGTKRYERLKRQDCLAHQPKYQEKEDKSEVKAARL